MAYWVAYRKVWRSMAFLTDAKARTIHPDGPALPHGGVTGLVLHPSSRKGHGKWVLRYVSPVTKRRRNAGLGAYPEVGLALAAARARAMRQQLVHGIDPLDAKAKATEEPAAPTFEQAARKLHTELSPGWKNGKHAQQWISTLDEYAFPTLGPMALEKIQPRDIADALRPIWLQKPETASRVKQRLHAVMAWGWANGLNQSNPVDVVNHLLPQQPSKTTRTQHQPAMPWRLLPDFIAANLGDPAQLGVIERLLLFLILTATRSGEARGMCWTEVNAKSAVWTVPSARMKGGQVHRVPLPSRAIDLMNLQRGMHPHLVFPSLKAIGNIGTTRLPEDGEPPVSDMTLTKLLRRLNAPSDTPARFATAHGFRSTFRDWCSERGVAKDLAERSLAHTIQNKVEAAYHRTDLLDQRRPLMQEWADFCFSSVPT